MKDVVKTQPNKNSPKRRRRKRNLSLYYLMMLVFVVIVVVILSRTVLFNINEYALSGNSRYSKSQILSAGGLEIGDNMFALNIEKTEEQIKDALIFIDDITIERRLPDGLDITVVEATEFACCEYEGNRYAVISRGGRYLQTEQPNKREDLLMLKGMDLTGVSLGASLESKDSQKLKIILDLLEAIDKTCPGKIDYIDITDRTNIHIGYDSRIDIDFGSSLDYEYKLRYITAIITDNLTADAKGKIIYHSSAAGASFISEQDMAQQENSPTTQPSVSQDTTSGVE